MPSKTTLQMRKVQPLAKSKDPDYVQATAYIPLDLHADTHIKLIQRKRRRQPVTEFSEVVEVLLAKWVRGEIDI